MHYVAIEESRRDLLKQLQERLEARLEPARAAAIEAFARHFYATVPANYALLLKSKYDMQANT